MLAHIHKAIDNNG
jgi:hypothetical protein